MTRLKIAALEKHFDKVAAVKGINLDVPEGELVSYRHLATVAGMPKAVRAVASAVAANPVAWLVPCHRVIGADGSGLRDISGGHSPRGAIGGDLSADGRRLVVVATLDNLLKGAATQALQNLNLAFGLPETMGIPT